MGIYDRDYVRDRPGGPGMGGPGLGGPGGPWGGGGPMSAMRAFSVNTWLIIICVAVFIIDPMTPMQWVSMGTHVRSDVQVDLDSDQIQNTEWQVVQRDQAGNALERRRALFDAAGREIGYQSEIRMRTLQSWLHFSTMRGFFEFQVWRFIGFQFLHAHLPHILFNMIGLFFFGPIIERYLGGKRYLAFYLLCGICGALMYLLLNLGGILIGGNVPFLLFNSPYLPLIGASAGVFGVLMAGAYIAPNVTVLLFFFLPMRLATLAYLLVAMAVLTLLTGGPNAGGEAGHLGGAIAGFYFIRHPQHLHGFFDILGRVDPTSHHYRGKRQAPRSQPAGPAPRRGGKSWFAKSEPSDQEIDRILDKISNTGLHSLTEQEKKILSKASHRDREP